MGLIQYALIIMMETQSSKSGFHPLGLLIAFLFTFRQSLVKLLNIVQINETVSGVQSISSKKLEHCRGRKAPC